MEKEVYSLCLMCSARCPVKVRARDGQLTGMIHPEAVFMLHDFGRKARMADYCFSKGLLDAQLQENLTDMVDDSPAFHETFITVKAA